jgi:hypothetical protein
MKSATELLAEMLKIYDEPDKGAGDLYLWIHQQQEEMRDTVDESQIRETDDSDIERADWAVQRGIAKMRTTAFQTYEVEFQHYSTCFAHLNAAIACISAYAASHGVDRARGEGE